jgi:hypothetical protein
MTEATANNIEILYAHALIFKLYKAKLITREVMEKAEIKCAERLKKATRAA